MKTLTSQLHITTPAGVTVRDFHHRDCEADRNVITQIFQNQDYSIDRLQRGAELRALYERMVAEGKTPLIVDAGANIGAASVYFSTMFPLARVAAVEPDRDNCELLQRNTDISVWRTAVGSHGGITNLTDPGIGQWGFRSGAIRPWGIFREGDTRVESMTSLVSTFTDQHDNPLTPPRPVAVPFICKIDIEGAEEELFSANTEWAAKFPLIIIELHDWLIPGRAVSRNFLRWHATQDRDFVTIGENVFSIRNPL